MKTLLWKLFLFIHFYSFAQIEDFSTVSFEKADRIASNLHVKELTNLPNIAYKLTHALNTPVEKFRAIYTWVALNIESDYYYQEKILKNRKKRIKDTVALNAWNEQNLSVFFEKLVTKKKTICTGYAYLVRELAGFVGINCKIIDGYGRNGNQNIGELEIPNHSWNAVSLNNKWYLCDPTWSSGYAFVSRKKVEFIHKYTDGYFLADPTLFIKNHYPLDEQWTLLKDVPTTATFVSAPLIYNASFQHKIMPIKPEKFRLIVGQNQFVNFEFKILNELKKEDVAIEIINGNAKSMSIPIFLKSELNRLKFKHKFLKRGLFDVHIKIKDDVVATFVVKVNKL